MTNISLSLKGQRITVMGLGLHGGGVATAQWLATQGAKVTITDLRSHKELASAIQKLRGYAINYRLGQHSAQDFSQCDMVVKNPAVPRTHPLLAHATRIESDLSLFLDRCPATIIAVTGTKGKSTTTAAIAHLLQKMGTCVYLGGNIGVSPLSFVDTLHANDLVVLELSSFQLGDLRLSARYSSRTHFSCWGPAISLVTNIFPDHLDYYPTMQSYVEDKILITAAQSAHDVLILSGDVQQQPYSTPFLKESKARVAMVLSAPDTMHNVEKRWNRSIDYLIYPKNKQEFSIVKGEVTHSIPLHTQLTGDHNRANLMYAAMAAYCLNSAPLPSPLFSQFGGLSHRMEYIGDYRGCPTYNDSAATIPEATLASVRSCQAPVHLIAGGSDKRLQLAPFVAIAQQVHKIYLLKGSATQRLVQLFNTHHIPYQGPFSSLKKAIAVVLEECQAPEIILLSPGCASFGMFKNEFERGDRFRNLMNAEIHAHQD